MNTAFYLLSNHRRRYALYALQRLGGSCSFEELVDSIEDIESETVGAGISREQITIALHHTHLPKLSAAGLVTYEPKIGRVSYESNPLIERLLKQVIALELDGPAVDRGR